MHANLGLVVITPVCLCRHMAISPLCDSPYSYKGTSNIGLGVYPTPVDHTLTWLHLKDSISI